MMTSWQETLLGYSFTVHYWPGVLNVLPDTLSHLFPPLLHLPHHHHDAESELSLAYMHVLQNAETVCKVVGEDK